MRLGNIPGQVIISYREVLMPSWGRMGEAKPRLGYNVPR